MGGGGVGVAGGGGHIDRRFDRRRRDGWRGRERGGHWAGRDRRGNRLHLGRWRAGRRRAPGTFEFADPRFQRADAPEQADAEHGADDGGNGNEQRCQYEEGEEAVQVVSPALQPLLSESSMAESR
jgi:hypothetical protein